MKPKTNFEEWSQQFQSSLESKSNYISYFSDCEELIQEYLTSRTLSEPIQSKTHDFISKLIPNITKSVLKLRRLSSNDLELTITFLSKILTLLVFQFINGDLSQSKNIDKIFDCDLKLYSNPPEKQFTLLCRLFIQDGNFDKILKRLSDDNPEMQHLSLALELREAINFYVPIPIEKVQEASYQFIQHFKDENSLRKIDTNELQTAIQDYIFDQMQTESESDYTYIFKFCLYLIHCKILEKQLLGVDFLVCVIENFGKSDPRLANWVMTTDLIDYICTADVHTEVLNRIAPLFKYLSRQNKIDSEIIQRLLSKISIIHKSEQESMYNLIFASMKGFSDESIFEFLQNHELDSTFISLIMENTKNPEIKQFCVTVLLKRESTKDLLAGLTKLTRSYVLSYIQQSSSEMSPKYLEELLPKLIETSKDPKGEFDTLIKTITEKGSHDVQSQDNIFSILKTYVSKLYYDTLPFEIVKNLFNIQNDKLWLFLRELLEKRSTQLLDSQTFKFLDNFFNTYDYSSVTSIDFVTFLYSYSLRSMDEKNQLDSYDFKYSNYTFAQFPQSFLPIFEKLYLSIQADDDSQIVKILENYLLDFYLKFDDWPVEQFAKEIYDTFIPNLSPESKSLTRTVSFLRKLIQKLEEGLCLEDFGMPRHEDQLKQTSIVNLHFGDETRHIHFETDNQFTKLIKRIKTFTKYDSYYCKLKLYSNNFEIQKYEYVYKYDNDLTFDVRGYGQIIDRQMLSIILHQNYHLTEKVYELFKKFNDIDQRALNLIWSLIQLLPSLDHLNVDIGQCENEYILRYSLEMISLDKNFNNYASLIDLLVSRKLKNSDLFIMNVILSIFNDEFVQYFPKIAKIILDQFSNKKDLEIPAKLLRKMSKRYENRSEILLQYPDELITMLFSAEKSTAKYITETLLSIQCPPQLFEKVFKNLDNVKKQENLDYIIKCLFEISQNSEIDNEAFIKSIIGIGDSIDINVLLNSFESFVENDSTQKDLIKNYLYDTLLTRIVKEDEVDSFVSFLSFLVYFEDIEIPLKKLIESIQISGFNIEKKIQTHSSKNTYKRNEFCGIKNLGVTCFMNSILQQLFYTFPFRYLVMKTEKDSLLFNIFSDLMNENNDVISMKKYVKEVNKIINTDEQQDAYEFYQLLIDKQNQDCQAIFTGNFVNHIEGINNDYNSVNTENFTALDMTVNNKENLDESFHSFVEPEFFSIQDNVDVKRYQKIGKAPPVLVIQLKRFEIDYNNFTRYKINSVYQFPQEIDLGPYMDDSQIEHKYYELFGVVIHSGQANSGHYYSLIKLNNKWYEFNDTCVYEFDENKFQRVAFGAKKSMKSGYMLFYHEKGAVYTDNDISIRYDQLPDLSLMNISSSSSSYNCLLTDGLFQFALTASSEFQIEYLFKIFIHSTDDYLQCDRLFDSLSEKLENSVDFFYQTATKEIDSFIQMVLKCKSLEIKEMVINLIKLTVNHESSSSFFKALFEHLSDFLNDYTKFSEIGSVLFEYAKTHIESIDQSIILQFISSFYKTSTTKQNTTVDFSDFFEILNLIKADISILKPDFPKIIKSKCNSGIIFLLSKEQQHELLSLFDNAANYVSFIANTSTNKSNTTLFKELIFEHSPENIEKSSLILSILIELRKSKGSSSFRHIFIDDYTKLILPYFFDSDRTIRLNAEQITYELYPVTIVIPKPANTAINQFSETIPFLVEQSIPLIEENYENISISNFLNIFAWLSKRCHIDPFNDLKPIFELCMKNNEEDNIDENLAAFVDITARILTTLYSNDTIPERDNVFPLLLKICKSKQNDALSANFFVIVDLLSDQSVSDLYETKEMIDLFGKQIEWKTNDEVFETTFEPSFSRAIVFSEELANNFINIFKTELKFEENVFPIQYILQKLPHMIQCDFYLLVVNYVINCALHQAEVSLFREITLEVNILFDDQVEKGLKLDSLNRDDIINSLPFLEGDSSKTKRAYGQLLVNFSSIDQSLAELIITNLLEQFTKKEQIDHPKNYKYFTITFLNSMAASSLFQYFNVQFANDIFPKIPIQNWVDFELFDFLKGNIDNVIDGVCTIMRYLLMKKKIRYGKAGYKNSNRFAEFVAHNVPMEKIGEMIESITDKTEEVQKNLNEFNSIISYSMEDSSDYTSSSD